VQSCTRAIKPDVKHCTIWENTMVGFAGWLIKW